MVRQVGGVDGEPGNVQSLAMTKPYRSLSQITRMQKDAGSEKSTGTCYHEHFSTLH